MPIFPSLLSLPYLGGVKLNDPVYQNTRRFVWSENNPFFFKGKVAEGIGGPHIGLDMVWPMSIVMKGLTSTNDKEIKWCLDTLQRTHGKTRLHARVFFTRITLSSIRENGLHGRIRFSESLSGKCTGRGPVC